MTILIFILILSILVLVHEFGHFITAKKSGIKVEEFGLGIPPKIFGKKIGETIYSINLLPFGGFVRLYGEDLTDKKYLDDPKSFISKPWYKRVLVITAGVLMNFILAIVLYYIFFISTGYKTFSMPLIFDHDFRFGTSEKNHTVAVGFIEESNLDDMGVSVGDVVLSVNGEEVSSAKDIHDALLKDYENAIVVVKKYKTNEEVTLDVTPVISENGDPVLGVYLGSSVSLSYDKPLDKALVGFMHSYNVLSYSMSSLGEVISMSVKSKDISPVSESVSGPVGIYNIVDSIVSNTTSNIILGLIDFTALLSLSLGFLNIMPFPALDGGRLLFVLIELLRGGKKVSQEFEAKVHGIGMLVLLGLFVLITVKDIML